MEANPADTENRIILITDEQPNVGDVTTEGLGGSIKNNSDAGIYTTTIGEAAAGLALCTLLACPSPGRLLPCSLLACGSGL